VPEKQPDRPVHEHPVIAGLLALVGVALAIGLVLGLVVTVGSRVLGLGSAAASDSASDQATMYLPFPQKTPTPTGAQITLGPNTGGPKAGHHKPRSARSGSKAKAKSARDRISLSASTTSARPMEQFDLSGVYPGGEGAILTVQRFQNGGWSDFPASGSVSGGSFQIPVQTSQGGVNRLRVIDTDHQRHSNEVRVTIR